MIKEGWFILTSIISNSYIHIAIGSTIFFVLQSVFTFNGIGDNFEIDADFDSKIYLDIKEGNNIAKVTVWDNLGNGGDGKPARAKFLSGMLSSLPPLQDVFNMAGMNLPDIISYWKEAPGEVTTEVEVETPEIDPK